MDELKSFLEKAAIPFQEQVLLKQKTWIKCGGKCDYWVVPDTLDQLTELVRYLYTHHLSFEVVGQTSNLFFRESYHAFVIISTIKLSFYSIQDSELNCNCGMNVTKLARIAVNQGYKGFYGLVGLPGTVGAAIYNNAGCYDCSLSSMLCSILFLNEKGEIETLGYQDIAFDHRSSVFKRGEKKGVILSVKLKLYCGNPEIEVAKAEKVKQMRHSIDEQSSRTLGSVYSRFIPTLPVRIITKILSLLHRVFPFDIRKVKKNVLLICYGYRALDKYVSDRNLNTYIWRDGEAESYFGQYEEFMKKTNKQLTMEIEIKS